MGNQNKGTMSIEVVKHLLNSLNEANLDIAEKLELSENKQINIKDLNKLQANLMSTQEILENLDK